MRFVFGEDVARRLCQELARECGTSAMASSAQALASALAALNWAQFALGDRRCLSIFCTRAASMKHPCPLHAARFVPWINAPTIPLYTTGPVPLPHILYRSLALVLALHREIVVRIDFFGSTWHALREIYVQGCSVSGLPALANKGSL